ncbi:BLUF domain-containing protein [Maricaulis sp. W15]|uniref:BLUF domain-containing protein n=1 Tax=Maricaulis sp. W15 TaxID=1772333 RepID=UPI000AE9FC18|nr:BLUF domain-containing protein [Maricaulis sp. W15]
MLHRMVLAARSQLDTGPGALNGEFGSLAANCLQTSVENGLTGGLVADSGVLLEVLEGESAALCDRHSRAERDPRLDQLQVLEFIPVLHRTYATWSVATADDVTGNASLVAAVIEKRAGPFAVGQHVRAVLMQGALAATPPLCVAA